MYQMQTVDRMGLHQGNKPDGQEIIIIITVGSTIFIVHHMLEDKMV